MTDPSLPPFPSDHPASIQFSAWLSAFNTADKETLLSYHIDSRFPYSVLPRAVLGPEHELQFAKGTGGFDVVKVESSEEPSFVVVVLKEKIRSQHARANMSVDISKPSYPATKFDIRPIVTPIELIPTDDPRRPEFEKALAPLTQVRRQAVLDGISDVLREQYVNPNVGEDIIAAVEAHLKNGDYDEFEDNEKFAMRLTKDIREAGNDKHMFVAFLEPRPERKSNDEDKPDSHLEHLRPMNFGFGFTTFDTHSVPGRTIATLAIQSFVPSEEKFASDWREIRAAIGGILSSVADADVLIVDLRSNTGGSPDTVAFIQSYLLDGGPLHLLDMVDRDGMVKQSHSTLHVDELPAGTKRFGGTKPLLVLTTNQTISGGEDMAYSLQAFKRATFIIGEGSESTAGAANPMTKPRFVAEEIFGKGWWFVGVPNLKPVHAITGSNWEGVGVKSDVVTGKGEWEGESNAKEVARRLAIQIFERDKEL